MFYVLCFMFYVYMAEEKSNNKKLDLEGGLEPPEDEAVKHELSRILGVNSVPSGPSVSDISKKETAPIPPKPSGPSETSPSPKPPLPFKPPETLRPPGLPEPPLPSEPFKPPLPSPPKSKPPEPPESLGEEKPPALFPKPSSDIEDFLTEGGLSPLPPKPSVPKKEREFPRERESFPSKKEREFISREEKAEADTHREIIRTFQGDLLRREAELTREEKIPEKEIAGFAPPRSPEMSKARISSKFKIPKIAIPKISIKFSLIIIVLALFLCGFYLFLQFKPCIPPFCKEGKPTVSPTPSVVICDEEVLKSICLNPQESFPECNIEKLCQEMNISPCQRKEICEFLIPPPACEPVELIIPESLLSFAPEEKIIISKKSKTEILSGLGSIAGNESYSRPSLVRVLIEYSPHNCEKAWISAEELLEIFEVGVPQNFFSSLKENYTLVYYLPGTEEKNDCLALNVTNPLCYGPRLAMVFSVFNMDLAKFTMTSWEKTIFDDFKPFILGEATGEAVEFKDFLYKGKVPVRYKNLPFSTTALNYGFYKEVLVIGTSKNSLLKTIDSILKKGE